MTARKTGRPKSRKPRVAALVTPGHLVERAAGELRRGAPVLIRAAKRNESVVAVAAETVADTTLAALVKLCGAPFSILTHARAATLKVPLYTPDVVGIPQTATVTAAELRALADPSTDLDHPLKGPFVPHARRTAQGRRGERAARQARGTVTGDRGLQARGSRAKDPADGSFGRRSPGRRHQRIRGQSRVATAIARARPCAAERSGGRRARRVPPDGWRPGTLRGRHRGQARQRARAAGTRARAHPFRMLHRRSARLAQMRLRRPIARRGQGDRGRRAAACCSISRRKAAASG